MPVTNPQRGGQLSFAIYSEGIRSSVRLRCYSPSFNAVLDQDLGPLGPGWQRVSLPALGLAQGVYWARLSAEGKPLGKPARFLYLP
jgi:hypothetical protein